MKNAKNAKSTMGGLRTIPSNSLVVQFAWAFMLMSVIPFIITIFLLFMVNAPTFEGRVDQAWIAIMWMLVSSFAGYFIVRKSVKTLSLLTWHVKKVISGKSSERILLNEDNEIGELARYFERVNRNLEFKIQELEYSKKLIQNIFHKIGEAINSSRGIDSLLELVLESVANTINGRGGFIMLVSPISELLEPSVIYCGDNDPPKISFIKIGQNIIGKVAKDNKPAIILSLEAQKDGLPFKSLLCVPLNYKNKVIGVMAIYDRKTKDYFSKEDLDLFKDIASQTAMAISNFQLNLDIEKAYLETIRALAMAVEAKDPYSGGHLDRVSKYATDIGRELGLGDEDMRILHDGAYLHDLGKIGISDKILLKNGKLTDEEFEEMKKHPIIGETIIKPVKSLSKLCNAVRAHQERWDGTGYPDGLKGEDIPLYARILAVADVYDALTTERPYKKAMSVKEAREELKKEAGIKLDKKVVDAFLKTI